MWGWAQHLLRLKLRVAKRESRKTSRPRNSCGPSYRPPQDERRRLRASVVARLGGGAAHSVNACASRGRERRPIIGCSLPDRWLLIVGSERSAAHAWSRSVTSSVPMARVRRLARPLPSPLRREAPLYREDGPAREHVQHRAPDLVRENGERLPLPVLPLDPRQDLLAVLRMAQEQHGRF